MLTLNDPEGAPTCPRRYQVRQALVNNTGYDVQSETPQVSADCMMTRTEKESHIVEKPFAGTFSLPALARFPG